MGRRVAGAVEVTGEAGGMGIGRGGGADALVIEAIEGVTLGLYGLEREYDVVDGDRGAVLPTRLGALRKGDPRPILGPFDRLRD